VYLAFAITLPSAGAVQSLTIATFRDNLQPRG